MEGLELGDFVAGVSASLVDNSYPFPNNYRKNRSEGKSQSAFQAGETVGDVISIVQGVLEIAVGGGEATVTTLGVVTAPAAAAGVAVAAHGGSVILKAGGNLINRNYNSDGKRSQNKIPDKGEPNSVKTNKSGTTKKKYGPDGNVQKEYNKGHGKDAPKNEQKGHIHDYKPNPRNPSGAGDKRYGGRSPKKGELIRDFGMKKQN